VTAGLAPLIHELQAERSLSTSYIDSDRKAWGQRLAEQRRRLDRVAASYRASAKRLGADDRLLAEKIGYGVAELGRLDQQRQAIDTAPVRPQDLEVGPSIELHEEEGEEDIENALEHGHGPIDTPGKALEQYTDTISDLLDINTEIAPGSNDEALLKGVAASVALARAKDFADAQRSLMQRVYAARRFQGAEHTRLSALVAAETIYQAQFEANATQAQHDFFEDMVSGDDVEAVDRYLEAALGSGTTQPRLGVPAQDWFDAMTVKLDRMRTVEERLSGDVIATSSAIQRGADRRALLYSLLLAAGLVLALVLALITARSLIRPMRRLEAAAEETAEHRLPGVVQRLQEGEQVDLRVESAPPIEVRSRDEIGHLAEAFNTVHRVAVRVAGREAALRRSVGDMFLNLARRSQSLIERQLEVIDELELSGSEADMRTRMRRNAENLIILSGSEPARRWRGPVGLVDVVRAAVEEIKEHTRVELLPIDQVQLAGHAAADVMRRLAKPPDIDFALAKMLGFFVVTQLAAKHGIKVQLRHSWYGGVTALVLLPKPLIEHLTELAPLPSAAERRPDRSPAAARCPKTPTWPGSTAGCPWSTCRCAAPRGPSLGFS
jgi:HAMP domain-containing protein